MVHIFNYQVKNIQQYVQYFLVEIRMLSSVHIDRVIGQVVLFISDQFPGRYDSSLGIRQEAMIFPVTYTA